MTGSTETSTHEFSVIIPTLDEEAEIEETLRRAKRALGPDCELWVIDGGSLDRTVELAGALAKTLSADPSRGGQMRVGAAAASGQILVFLHADTWLEQDAGNAIRLAVARGFGAGCLRFALRPPSRDVRYRLLEYGVNWRTRVFSTATGDQAIFCTREAYDQSGGVEDIPLFEDVTLVRALRRKTGLFVADSQALTSRRRWEHGGFFRTLATHWFLRAAHACGVTPGTLSKLYRNRAQARKDPVHRSSTRP